MKTLILKIRNHLVGFLIGVFATTAVTVFAASNPWSIGSLFEYITYTNWYWVVSWAYKLIGTNIKDGSITPTQIGFNYAGSTSKWWPATSVNFNGGLTDSSYPTFNWIRANSSIILWWPIYFADGTSLSTAALYAPPIVGSWVNVVNHLYDWGTTYKSNFYNGSVILNPTKKLLGLRISWSSDNWGTCIAYINWFFSAGVTQAAFIDTLSLFWNFNGGFNYGKVWYFLTKEFIFESISSWINLWAQNSYGNNSAYNKWFVWGYLPAGSVLNYTQFYVNGQGPWANNCVIDALYSKY